MRHNRRNRVFNEEAETKKLVYISVSVVIIAVLTFVITYVVYSNVLSNNSNDADMALKLTELSASNNEQTSQASSPIGKNVNEVKETQNEEDTTKIAINTSNMENKKENKLVNETQTTSKTSTNEDNSNSNKTTANEVATTKVEKKADPTFIKPVEGEILREFAKENLVYSDTLKEWVTHNGIDIKSEKTTIVKAAAEGTIKSIKNDPRYGITVVIEHTNGYVSIYSNLLTAEFVKEGENVKQGQTIGTVGNTASFEIADEYHLHFEILKDNEYLNPSEYIK